MAEPTLQELCAAVNRSNINPKWRPFIVHSIQEFFKILNKAYASRKTTKLLAPIPNVEETVIGLKSKVSPSAPLEASAEPEPGQDTSAPLPEDGEPVEGTEEAKTSKKKGRA